MIDIKERWKTLPEYPYQMRTTKGWVREKAREFIKMVIRGNYWVDSRDISLKYGISRQSATILFGEIEAGKKANTMPVHRFGFRDDTYFTEDYLLNGVKYNPDELKGQELEIFNKLK